MFHSCYTLLRELEFAAFAKSTLSTNKSNICWNIMMEHFHGHLPTLTAPPPFQETLDVLHFIDVTPWIIFHSVHCKMKIILETFHSKPHY